MRNRPNKTQLAFYRARTANRSPDALGKRGKPAPGRFHLGHHKFMNVVIETVFAKRTYYLYENKGS